MKELISVLIGLAIFAFLVYTMIKFFVNLLSSKSKRRTNFKKNIIDKMDEDFK